MPDKSPDLKESPQNFMKLSRLETLGDAIFAFALTLLAFDLRLPEFTPDDLGKSFVAFLPKLVIFIFTFLVVAQQWDVHQRTMRYISRIDGRFIWLNLLSLMFIVLLPASANILGKYPLQPLALLFFGTNLALFCLISWFQWRYASDTGNLIMENMDAQAVKMVSGLWLYPPVIIAISIPISLISVLPVYAIWLLMPILSYTFSIRTIQKIRERTAKKGKT